MSNADLTLRLDSTILSIVDFAVFDFFFRQFASYQFMDFSSLLATASIPKTMRIEKNSVGSEIQLYMRSDLWHIWQGNNTRQQTERQNEVDDISSRIHISISHAVTCWRHGLGHHNKLFHIHESTNNYELFRSNNRQNQWQKRCKWFGIRTLIRIVQYLCYSNFPFRKEKNSKLREPNSHWFVLK